MIRLKRWALPLTGLGVTLALVLATPRAAHAVAAALVQVTNTASNPAVTQDTSHMASQMVHLSCFGEVNGFSQSCVLISPSGELGSVYSYTVPAGQSLVITSVDVTGGASGSSGGCPAALGVFLNFAGNIFASSNWYWQLAPSAGTTTHFTYPPGFAVNGTTLTGLLVGSSNASCYAIAHIYGYLTAN